MNSELQIKNFDFVIIGGGTAGNVIANRLTEDRNTTVLVIEAGPRNDDVSVNTTAPFFFPQLSGVSPFNWNYTTIPQQSLDSRSLLYTSGHVLGGSSSLLGEFYTRGSSEDYDRFAAFTGDSGWSWNSLQPYIRKNERWTAPRDDHDTTGQFDPQVHGFNGILSVSLAGFPHTTDSRVMQVTQELSGEFPFNLDMNSGHPIGLGWLQGTINRGKRSSSATAYLAPTFLNRPNLHVVLNTRVTRVLPRVQGSLEFNTVEFTSGGAGAPVSKVTASKEIVLSAGLMGTPHILTYPGIGDRQQLSSIGVSTLLNLPDVGKNLSDHPLLSSSWFVNATNTEDDLLRNPTCSTLLLRSGFRTRLESWVIHEPRTSDGRGCHRMRQYSTNSLTPLLAQTHHTLSFLSRWLHKMEHPPVVDPGYLNNDFDRFSIREGVKQALRFVQAPAMRGYILQPFGALANATTDAQLDAFIRANTGPAFHGVGTASMSPFNATFGVVDPDLRVKGVRGLRIVDASVMPFVPAAHTQAPVYIIAERAADLIKAAWQ
ncbi:hypothetical protein HGRIS_012427 [Hohenbuehelia grisea]|uniref:Uncharacterized protein n=1 Tax=Hohenbuehelia grisea TaxID=104357 RepID=A0ABR3ISB8_9AGAR